MRKKLSEFILRFCTKVKYCSRIGKYNRPGKITGWHGFKNNNSNRSISSVYYILNAKDRLRIERVFSTYDTIIVNFNLNCFLQFINLKSSN